MPSISLHQATLLMRLHQDAIRPGMLLDFLEGQALSLAEHRTRPAGLDDWETMAAELRARLSRSLGLSVLPERGPLQVRTTGVIQRAGYSIEKLIFETLPGFTATAHLYLPALAPLPSPGVLFAPGHWMENAKLEPDIQCFCANLAKNGCVVLVYDPIGQGERLGDWLDHGHLETLLVGVSQEGLMVWESQRALDILESRPEVDSGRIGMIGVSGGGLNTFYTSALDSRIQVSVPICYVTTFSQMMAAERDRNWEDGVDLCNQVPQVMVYTEMGEILGLFAPRPLAVLAALQDWMAPIAGARQVFTDARKIYELYQSEENIRLIEVDTGHGFARPIREAALGWLAYWLLGKGTGEPAMEVELELIPAPYPHALTYIAPPDPAHLPEMRAWNGPDRSSPGLCLPAGEVFRPGPAINRLARSLAQTMTARRSIPPRAEQQDAWRQDMRRRVQKVLGPFPPPGSLKERFFKQAIFQGIFLERVVFESEPGITIPGIFFAPTEWRQTIPPVVYVDELGKEAGLVNGAIEVLLSAGLAVFAVDVRGIGESAASDFEAASNALMSDRPLFGQRVWDVLRSIDCLWNRVYVGLQVDKARITCLGRGWGGLLALYAAALDERIAAAVLWETPCSYQSLLVEQPAFPASIYLFDVLHQFDLSDLVDLVTPRPLLWVDPVNGRRAHLEEIHHFPHFCESSEVEKANVEIYQHFSPFANLKGIATWLMKNINP